MSEHLPTFREHIDAELGTTPPAPADRMEWVARAAASPPPVLTPNLVGAPFTKFYVVPAAALLAVGVTAAVLMHARNSPDRQHSEAPVASPSTSSVVGIVVDPPMTLEGIIPTESALITSAPATTSTAKTISSTPTKTATADEEVSVAPTTIAPTIPPKPSHSTSHPTTPTTTSSTPKPTTTAPTTPPTPTTPSESPESTSPTSDPGLRGNQLPTETPFRETRTATDPASATEVPTASEIGLFHQIPNHGIGK